MGASVAQQLHTGRWLCACAPTRPTGRRLGSESANLLHREARCRSLRSRVIIWLPSNPGVGWGEREGRRRMFVASQDHQLLIVPCSLSDSVIAASTSERKQAHPPATHRTRARRSRRRGRHCTSPTVDLVIRSTVAVMFVLNVDEIIYQSCCPASIMEDVEVCAPSPSRSPSPLPPAPPPLPLSLPSPSPSPPPIALPSLAPSLTRTHVQGNTPPAAQQKQT